MLNNLTINIIGAVAEHHGKFLAVNPAVSLMAALI